MPICINCSHPLPHLYTTYSKADDRSLGKGVRLTQCSNCKRFADKYVEHDYVVLFIDLVLIKPQVYRHLLFNRLNTGAANDSNHKPSAVTTTANTHRYDRLDPSIARLGILLVLFDVYITWARIEKGSSTRSGAGRNQDETDAGVLTNWPILGQYLFFLTMNLVSTFAQHGTIRILAQLFFSGPRIEDSRYVMGNSNEGGGATGHSRNSSAATERPARDRGRDRDVGVSSTVTSPAATPIRRNMQIPSLSPNRQGHGNDSLRSTPIRSDSMRTQPAQSQQQQHHDHTGQNAHVDHYAMYASPYRSPPSGSAISTALLVSSCTKLFPILLVIWPTTGELAEISNPSSDGVTSTAIGPFGSRAASYIGWVVLFNNIEALMILLQPESGYLGVTALAVAGFVVRYLVEGCFLSAVSLATDGSGPVGDFLSLLIWMKSRIGL